MPQNFSDLNILYSIDFLLSYGFNAIAIAFLSPGNIVEVIITSFFFAAFRSGANVMQRSAEVPVTVALCDSEVKDFIYRH